MSMLDTVTVLWQKHNFEMELFYIGYLCIRGKGGIEQC